MNSSSLTVQQPDTGIALRLDVASRGTRPPDVERVVRYGVILLDHELLVRTLAIVAPTSRSAPPASFQPEVQVAGDATRVSSASHDRRAIWVRCHIGRTRSLALKMHDMSVILAAFNLLAFGPFLEVL